jgi:quercetin 2,3-dioxygenase
MLVRRSDERGHAEHGWLSTYHTFSFAGYYDPEYVGFRSLRVINQDRVQPGAGFEAHPHADMEILTYVLQGALAHQDSMGNGSVIRPGDVQRMSAGTGVVHSEINHSDQEPVHLLQIWIIPERRGLPPSYEQKSFPLAERRGRLRLVASSDGRDGSVLIHQDVSVYAGSLEQGDRAHHDLQRGRFAWIHVPTGSVDVNGTRLNAGDGAAVVEDGRLDINGQEQGEVLLFDLA